MTDTPPDTVETLAALATADLTWLRAEQSRICEEWNRRCDTLYDRIEASPLSEREKNAVAQGAALAMDILKATPPGSTGTVQ